ncbi:MAG TPA: ABC transporter substrate-binding protein, partial [Candidatus Choladousia intestinipullorum]|nr:ABC transporter substrate-binding protein [Candidatus Choladousia intestinipullorum]
MKLRKVLAGLLAASMLVSALPVAASAESDDSITFGVICSITGNFPLAGENTQKGVNLALKEINEAGGVLGKEFQVNFQDDQGNQTGGMNAVNRLISEDVVAIVGPNMSSNVIAMSD